MRTWPLSRRAWPGSRSLASGCRPLSSNCPTANHRTRSSQMKPRELGVVTNGLRTAKGSPQTFTGRFWREADLRLGCQRPLSAVALALTQGVQLCLVQSLRDVRDQIRRVFDADRQPDRGVENAHFLADVSRNAGMGHACGQAGWQATECRPGSPPA